MNLSLNYFNNRCIDVNKCLHGNQLYVNVMMDDVV